MRPFERLETLLPSPGRVKLSESLYATVRNFQNFFQRVEAMTHLEAPVRHSLGQPVHSSSAPTSSTLASHRQHQSLLPSSVRVRNCAPPLSPPTSSGPNSGISKSTFSTPSWFAFSISSSIFSPLRLNPSVAGGLAFPP